MDIVSFVMGMSAAGDKTELLENVEIPVDFSNGNQTVEAEEGKAIKSAVIQKPAELVAENIKENTTIAGIAGTLPVYELTEKNVGLDFSAGDAVVMAENRKPFSKVTINKPETLVAENIAKDINIAGIIGTLESGGGEGDFTADRYFEGGYAEVNLPNAEAIKQYAFYQDKALTNIVMPKVKSIGNYAFQYCNNLTLTSLPIGLTSIGDYAFQSCSNLALTFLPEGITSISNYAFRSCGNLALTSLPEGITSIGDYAFRECSKLTLTSLPEGLTKLGSYAFHSCSNLALTSLPEGLARIDYGTFHGCSKLTLTSLPESLTRIDSSAFQNCTGLTSLTFKATPTKIDVTAFDYCSNLKTINVPWAEGAVSGAPWGATNATINYNYTGG